MTQHRPFVDEHKRRDLDRPRTESRYPGTCRGCNQKYPVGTPVTPVKGLGESTLWAHWQPDLACAKEADRFIRELMLALPKNRQHSRQPH